MKVEYSKRATADLHKVSGDSRRRFGDRVAAEVEARIHKIVDQIRESPESAPRVVDWPGVGVVALVRYPNKLFYRILGDTVRILHTSQQPWRGKD